MTDQIGVKTRLYLVCLASSFVMATAFVSGCSRPAGSDASAPMDASFSEAPVDMAMPDGTEASMSAGASADMSSAFANFSAGEYAAEAGHIVYEGGAAAKPEVVDPDAPSAIGAASSAPPVAAPSYTYTYNSPTSIGFKKPQLVSVIIETAGDSRAAYSEAPGETFATHTGEVISGTITAGKDDHVVHFARAKMTVSDGTATIDTDGSAPCQALTSDANPRWDWKITPTNTAPFRLLIKLDAVSDCSDNAAARPLDQKYIPITVNATFWDKTVLFLTNFQADWAHILTYLGFLAGFVITVGTFAWRLLPPGPLKDALGKFLAWLNSLRKPIDNSAEDKPPEDKAKDGDKSEDPE